MMALVRLLLLGLFVFLVVTVAAFVYLEWWQAILVSFLTFVALVYAAKFLIRYAVSRLGRFATDLIRVKSQVLRGAAVDVHSVRPVAPPAGALAHLDDPDAGDPQPDPASLDWYEIEATLFPAPDARGPMTHWDIDDLLLVPADTPDVAGPDDFEEETEEVGFHRVAVVADGEAVEPDRSKFHGPQRLRFTAGFPPGTRDWKFRYYFEQFGRIRLPAPGGVG